MSDNRPPIGSTDLIASPTLALADLGRLHDLTTPVPTCGDWTLADLIWHLTEVQDFWAYIVANRPDGPGSYSTPDRPADDQLADLLGNTCNRLVDQLTRANPADQAWSWADEQTVAFTLRRQTHEALVHHVDGLLATGGELPTVDPAIAADGIDELVTVMLTGVPPWATFTSTGQTIRLAATDGPDAWNLGFGVMTGTSPDTGTDYRLTAFELLDELDSPATTVSGTARDLLLWMWGRSGIGHLAVSGDPDGADQLRSTVTEATQ